MNQKYSNPIVPVVLSGGSGTRLWPQSRVTQPKQFVQLIGERSLFDLTVELLQEISSEAPIVVTNEAHRFLAAEELRKNDCEAEAIILEASARNTAPAIALAALCALESNPEALLLVAPSDHLIKDSAEFRQSIMNGYETACNDHIVTFGVEPAYAEPGYGYIKTSSQSNKKSHAFSIEEFTEKPSADIAQSYVDSGNYFWNSGIFLMKAKVLLDELKRLSPEIHECCNNAWQDRQMDGLFTRVSKPAFFACPSDSIDYAVMEKTKQAKLVKLLSDWSDLGSWDSVYRASPKDDQGNAKNESDAFFIESNNNYVRADKKLVTILGCDNLVVVDSGDALLISQMSKTQQVKDVVSTLRTNKRDEVNNHARVYRPWGDYEGVDSGSRYQVKRIVVKPGEKLSLQLHHHRAEHWTVVKGTAIVTKGDEEILLGENQSTYIPLGEVHRLENPGKIPLELIEVQSGSYLGEDDIIRLEDKYGRRKDDKPKPQEASVLKMPQNR